jgi:hypothetical protein
MPKLRYDGSDVDPEADYAIEGTTLRRLLQIVGEMSSGVVMNADRRRDLAQSVQERLIEAVKLDPRTFR